MSIITLVVVNSGFIFIFLFSYALVTEAMDDKH